MPIGSAAGRVVLWMSADVTQIARSVSRHAGDPRSVLLGWRHAFCVFVVRCDRTTDRDDPPVQFAAPRLHHGRVLGVCVPPFSAGTDSSTDAWRPAIAGAGSVDGLGHRS